MSGATAAFSLLQYMGWIYHWLMTTQVKYEINLSHHFPALWVDKDPPNAAQVPWNALTEGGGLTDRLSQNQPGTET